MKTSKRKNSSLKAKDLKKSILKELPKMLEKDEVFRGQFITLFKPYFAEKEKTEDRFNILLEEIKKLREEGEERWREVNKRLEEQSKRLEEQSRIIAEHTRRLEEHSKILEEHSRRLEEHSKILEEHSKILQDHSQKLELLTQKLELSTQKLELLTQELITLRKRQDVHIAAIGARWGIKTERAFRNGVKGLLENFLPIKVEQYEAIDYEGEVFEGRPGNIVELDLIIRDSELIVAEIKSSVSVGDVLLFEKKVRFFEKREGKKVSKKIIISPMIEAKALEFCKDFNIIAYTDLPSLEEGEAQL